MDPNEDEREEILQNILTEIKEEDKLEGPAKENLSKPIDKELTEIAHKESENRSAARINGIPYEFLHKVKQNDKKTQNSKN